MKQPTPLEKLITKFLLSSKPQISEILYEAYLSITDYKTVTTLASLVEYLSNLRLEICKYFLTIFNLKDTSLMSLSDSILKEILKPTDVRDIKLINDLVDEFNTKIKAELQKGNGTDD